VAIEIRHALLLAQTHPQESSCASTYFKAINLLSVPLQQSLRAVKV
jgi:hypothetical protein